MVAENTTANRLNFTTDLAELVGFAEIIFIAVGTPEDENGSADLGHVVKVASSLGKLIEKDCLVVIKSTVPVGTARQVQALIDNSLLVRKLDIKVEIASNPEFLREGNALSDFNDPDRIVIGVASENGEALLRKLYAPFNKNNEKIIVMDLASSELTKYAANIMLASRISTVNEIANIAELVGADIELIRLGIGADERIGKRFIYAGAGYGGSCFPKDVRALEKTAAQHGYKAELLQAIEAVNQRQKQRLFSKIESYFEKNLSDLTIAIWGLAFKPDTDDMREAPSLVLIDQLVTAGAKVNAYDPKSICEARKYLDKYTGRVNYCEDKYAAAAGADGLVITTEWEQFLSPDFATLLRLMKQKVIFDGRNIWDPEVLHAMGFQYYGIGRNLNTQENTQ